LINVASNKNGISYGKKWIHIDGFSENVINYIHEYEADLDKEEN
jgi:60 kDa SS-A/Ro ribonucleoprotein